MQDSMLSEHMGQAKTPDFVFIANAWSAGEQNPTSKHRIALELAQRGHRLLWVEGSGMRAPALGSGRDRGTIARKVRKAFRGAVPVDVGVGQEPRIRCEDRTSSNRTGQTGGVWVVGPLFLPFPKYSAIRVFNGWLCRTVAGRWARRMGVEIPVLVNYVPVLHEAMRGWPGKRIYHCVDRWDAFAMYDQAVMAAADEQCCRLADKVIASSAELETRCGRFNRRVRLITHGVDHGHFAGALSTHERPPELPEGRMAGFFGLLSEWTDQDLLLALARRMPEVGIILIGGADVDTGRLSAQRNIRMLGPRPFVSLPSYIAHFDVGLIPFVVNDLTRAVNPIKLREMLAAGCPVVSTCLPEVASYKGKWVDVAASHEEFVDCVQRRIVRPPTPAERAEISASVSGETWAAKVDAMLQWIQEEE